MFIFPMLTMEYYVKLIKLLSKNLSFPSPVAAQHQFSWLADIARVSPLKSAVLKDAENKLWLTYIYVTYTL